MAEGKRFKKRQKRYIYFFLLYIALVVLIFVNYTFSRYTETTETALTVSPAKFTAKVNGIEVGSDEPFVLNLSSTNNNTYGNKIAPSLKEEYFEIEIDPTGAEVSIEYKLIFDLTNHPDIKLTKYTKDNGLTFKEITDNTIRDDKDLPNQDLGFTADDKINLKIYWEWNTDITNPNPQSIETDIPVIAVISQKIN